MPTHHLTARLVFIYKDEIDSVNGNLIDSFRPISVTSILFKILEITLLKKIKALIKTERIPSLNQQQIGFQRNLSTNINIVKLMADAQIASNLTPVQGNGENIKKTKL